MGLIQVISYFIFIRRIVLFLVSYQSSQHHYSFPSFAGDLCLRVGLHSGAVTAGVLRGEKSRFQLFGDTVNTGKIELCNLIFSFYVNSVVLTVITIATNDLRVTTAARMESTGAPNKIQMSLSTAKLLQEAGKKWAKKREGGVEAKGKGRMETFWLQTGTGRSAKKESAVSESHATLKKGPGNLTPIPVKKVRAKRNSLLLPTENSGRANNLMTLRNSATKSPPVPGSLDVSDSKGGSVSKMNGSSHGSLHKGNDNTTSLNGPSVHSTKRDVGVDSKKTLRLVKWNAEVLSRLLKGIVARRNAMKQRRISQIDVSSQEKEDTADIVELAVEENTVDENKSAAFSIASSGTGFSCTSYDSDSDSEVKTMVFDEVKEIIQLPMFDAQAAKLEEDVNHIQLEEAVRNQLVEYVTEVASMYRYNPFHNL